MFLKVQPWRFTRFVYWLCSVYTPSRKGKFSREAVLMMHPGGLLVGMHPDEVVLYVLALQDSVNTLGVGLALQAFNRAQNHAIVKRDHGFENLGQLTSC